MIRCEIVDPLLEPRWNRWILEIPGATFFHTSEWAHVLTQSYNFTLHNAVVRDGSGQICAILPVAEVRSWWTGRRGVCLPFSDECAPLARNPAVLASAVQTLSELGRRRRWDYLEIRGGGETPDNAIQSDEFLTHRIPLEATEQLQFSRLKDTHRRNIRKAQREGVEIHHFRSTEGIRAYYALHCLTRKRLGVPPQPWRFFRLLEKYVIEAGRGFVSLARFDQHWIAGAVYFEFASEALYKFGASNPEFQHLRANNLLMWEALHHFREKGLRQLSLGRTDTHSTGLLQFKRGWGGEESRVAYYRMGICRSLSTPKAGDDHHRNLREEVLRRLPIGMLRGIGALLYRHFG